MIQGLSFRISGPLFLGAYGGRWAGLGLWGLQVRKGL